jgi:hypothetical protein
MIATLLAIATNLSLSLLWIPRHGALGAAGAMLAMTAVRNGFNLAAMRSLLGLVPFNLRYLGLLAVHLVSAGSLSAAARLLPLPPVAGMLVVGLLQLPLATLLGYLSGLLDKTELDLLRQLGRARRRP